MEKLKADLDHKNMKLFDLQKEIQKIQEKIQEKIQKISREKNQEKNTTEDKTKDIGENPNENDENPDENPDENSDVDSDDSNFDEYGTAFEYALPNECIEFNESMSLPINLCLACLPKYSYNCKFSSLNKYSYCETCQDLPTEIDSCAGCRPHGFSGCNKHHEGYVFPDQNSLCADCKLEPLCSECQPIYDHILSKKFIHKDCSWCGEWQKRVLLCRRHSLCACDEECAQALADKYDFSLMHFDGATLNNKMEVDIPIFHP